MSGFGLHGSSMFIPHIAVFLGLFALGFGYWVCLQARTDTTRPKLGKFLGGFISIVAALGLVCIFYLSIKQCCKANMAKKDDWSKTHMQMMMERSMQQPLQQSIEPVEKK
ncbi:MAG: hypothetical protein A3H42_05440 [Deltaproteobacteria bacterium RIFCSPLOWO2_02_FULL_46_8]|nr:MAG: hypothetical protein A3H42_05440 [Deltaproteobacteria bacterium RIFCSPLOWO2_02_FULL_46_8]